MKTIYIVIISIIVGMAGFFGGMKYSENNRPDFRGNFRETGRQNSGQECFAGRPVNGEIVSVDGRSITVKMEDNQSKIVLFSENTRINQATQAAVSDLKQGIEVAVFGTENSDGSVTAQNIQLNPQLQRFRNITPPNGR